MLRRGPAIVTGPGTIRWPDPESHRRGTSVSSTDQAAAEKRRGAFSSRNVFIFAAIGSAVGLGNIWRFPMDAYENGRGAFLLPYLIALLTAGRSEERRVGKECVSTC